MFKPLMQELDSIMARDPAARSRLEVMLFYPGFQAIIAYRLSHWLWTRGWRLLGRGISQAARWLTGIEIHPGAEIGDNLFIDHGMGVVVGESSTIGDGVTLYQGVTLGGVAPSVDSASQRNQKRHPTLENQVIVGSGAQVLGPITVRRCARVGANAVVTKEVPEFATVVGIPAKEVQLSGRRSEHDERFVAYGTPTEDIPDPVARALDGLLDAVQSLRARVNELEGQIAEHEDLEQDLAAAPGETEGKVDVPRQS